jgi:hypothetical protein
MILNAQPFWLGVVFCRGHPNCVSKSGFRDGGSVRTHLSPRWVLSVSHFYPWPYAVGSILTPLRGCRLAVSFHHVVEILVLTHTLAAAPASRFQPLIFEVFRLKACASGCWFCQAATQELL